MTKMTHIHVTKRNNAWCFSRKKESIINASLLSELLPRLLEESEKGIERKPDPQCRFQEIVEKLVHNGE